MSERERRADRGCTGARLVDEVLNTPELNTLWHQEVQMMADRIIEMRHALVSELTSAGSELDWSHVTNQIGMFAFTGISTEQVLKCREQSVYMTNDGRISIAGLNTNNVARVAQVLHHATAQE